MTSFIVGDWLDANPTWAKKITDAGHELANHTYTHPSFLTLSREAMLDEIVRCRDLLERLSGLGRCFRPSGNRRRHRPPPEAVLDVAGEAGYAHRARLRRRSARLRGSRRRRGRTAHTRRRRPGSIVSMHFGHPGTIAAMPAILDGLVQKGLTPVNASELLA